MERLAYMECEKEKLSKESHELREQNELLEFRIVELEESHDKVSFGFNYWSIDVHKALKLINDWKLS